MNDIYLCDKPLKRLALQFHPQGLLFGDIAGVDLEVVRSSRVQELGVLVHPHFGYATIVLETTNVFLYFKNFTKRVGRQV